MRVALALFFAVLGIATPGLAQSQDAGSGGSGSSEGYPDASPSESKEIFAEQSEPVIDGLDEQSQPLGEGERVLEYRGDHIALVAPADGYTPRRASPQPAPEMMRGGAAAPTGDDEVTPSLVVSDLPLRSKVETGSSRPVDLSLERTASGFVASNPLVEVSASESASAGVAIGEGPAQIRVSSATGASPEGSSIDDLGVFYPEVATDTDMFVAPTALGAEVFNQLRSPASPERIELAVALPKGSELVAAGADGAVVKRDGRPVAHIAAPSAFDADGQPVPVVMDVEGSSLVLHVDHESSSFAYPILVDPAIDNYDSWGSQQVVDWKRAGYPNDGGSDTNKFYTRKQDPGQGAWAGALNKSWGPGLYVYANKNRTFSENEYAGWVYSPPRYVTAGLAGAPGTTAFVNQARFYPVQLRINGDTGAGVVGDTGNGPRLKVGIFEDRAVSDSPRGIGFPNGNSPYSLPNEANGLNTPYYQADGPIVTYNNSNGTSSGNSNGGDQKGRQVWFHLAAPTTRTTQALRESYLGGAEIYLSDGENPGALVSNASAESPTWTPWLSGTAARGITVSAADKAGNAPYGGLGVRSVGYEVRSPSGALLASPAQASVPSAGTTTACDGSHKLPCPVEPPARNFTYETSQLPNGVNYGLGLATDASDKRQPFFGNLWWIKIDRESPKPKPGASSPISGGLLSPTGPGNAIKVDVVDGSASADNEWDAQDRQVWRSGVQSIELFVDGASKGKRTFTCDGPLGSCPQEPATVEFQPSGVSDGDHSCRVEVRDAAGNPPLVAEKPCYFDTTIDTTIDSGPSGLTNDNTPTFGFSASKSGATFACRVYRIDAEGRPIDSSGQPATAPSYLQGCIPPKTFGPLADGRYRLEVKAKDRKGNEDETPASRDFTVDATPPETTITLGPEGASSDNTPTFDFSANEAGSTFECRMDEAPFRPCDRPKTYGELDDGAHTFAVRATDPAGNTDPTPATRSFTLDSPLGVEQLRCLIEGRDDESPCGNPTRWIADDPAATRDTVQRTLAFARDLDRGNQAEPNGGVAGIELTLPGKPAIVKTVDDCKGTTCPDYAGEAFEYSTDALPEGTSQASVRARDPKGKYSEPRPFTLRVDRTAPTYNVDDFEAELAKRPLKHPTSLYQQGRTRHEGNPDGPGLTQGQIYELEINASDAKTGVEQSGVKSIEVRVDGETKFRKAQSCAPGNCSLRGTFRFDPDDYRPNLSETDPNDNHVVTTIIADQAGNRTVRTFKVRVRPVLVPDSELERLGLEQYFHYDSTETGLSGAHVNLATGNLVWHRVPMVNPGRGLASFLNLTYNSYDYPAGGDRPPVEDNRFDGEYDEFGIGFSGSISGIARMNEPLGGVGEFAKGTSGLVPPEVTLTDPDGTRHTFKLNTEDSTGLPADPRTTPVDPGTVGLVYDSPPGVDLRLRTFSPGETNLSTPTGAGGPLGKGGAVEDGVLPEQREKFWAITRTDGVTYFFDGLGFARSIVDRDGNEIRFLYDHVVPATGESCHAPLGKPVPGAADPIVASGCEPRLARVVDAAGNDPGASQSLIGQRSVKIAYYGSGAPLRSIGKVESITDHANRKLSFAYDSRGLLTKLTEPGGSAAPTRATEFSYADDPDVVTSAATQSDPTDWPQLVRIKDPRGGVTAIDYCENRYTEQGPCDRSGDRAGERPKRRVEAIINRAGDSRRFLYGQSEGQQEERSLASFATVTDGRGKAWRTDLDPRDRPRRLTDPLGIKTELSWSQRNQVLEHTVAAGTSDEASSSFTYNDNGQLLSQTDPLGRTTYLSYCDHSGTHRADQLAIAGVRVKGVDEGETFVSDLTAIRRPAGNSWRYEIDGVARGSSDEAAYCAALRGAREARSAPDDSDSGGIKGHQTAQIDPLGVRAETSYNQHGLITSEVMDPGGLKLTTRYESYDDNGQPQVVIDPEGFDNDEGGGTGEESAHRWLYAYDVVGNVTAAVDPRGSAGFGPAAMPGPDGRFTTTLTYDSLNQLRSERTPKDTDYADPAARKFITRTYEYDLNGNQTKATDGETNATVTDFTAMDRPKLATDAEGSQVAYEYDGEQNLTRIVAPRGVATPIDGDYSTRFHLDAAGRRIATEQLSTDEEDLLTSYELDLRGNVTGVALPRNNSTLNADTKRWTTVSLERALANAAGADARYEMEYSDADNLLAQVEDPGGLDLRTEFVYDENDNQVQVIEPRGFSEGDEADFTTLTTYDARDQVTDTVDPLGGHTRYVRRADGLVVEQISPRGTESSTEGDFTTRYAYDANGNLTSRSIPYAPEQYGLREAELQQWKVTYKRNAVGDPVSITDATGNVAGYRCGPDDPAKPDGCADMTYWRQKREHTFANAFYDTGDLKSTERPSWWQLDWSSAQAETPDPGRRYAATVAGLAPDLAIPQGGPALSEAPGPAGAGEEMAGMVPGPEDLPSGPTDFGSVEPEPLPDFLPRSGGASLAYDREMRLKHVQDAAGKLRALSYDKVGRITEKSWAYFPQGAEGLPADEPDAESAGDRLKPITHTYTYDRNGNLDSYTDGEGTRDASSAVTYRWSFGYDQFDRRTSELAPGSRQGASDAQLVERELTRFGYDPNGNLAERVLPRVYKGRQLAFSYAYDEADRLKAETNPMGQSFSYGYDAAGNTVSETSPEGNRTEISYDPLGRQIEVSEGVGATWAGASLARTTRMAYDADGNLIETVAPGAVASEGQATQARVTKTTYDGRGLPWATTQGAGTEASRTIVQEFDPNGNLRRTVNPKGLTDGLPTYKDPDYAAGLPQARPLESIPPEDRPRYEEQAKRTQDAASDAAQHATVAVFDPNDQAVSLHMPWADEDPTTAIAGTGAQPLPPGANLNQRTQNARRFRQDFSYDRRGRMRTISSPYEWREKPGGKIDATTYRYYDTDWILSQSDPRFTEQKAGPDGTSKLEAINERAVSYGYDRRGVQTLWLTDGYSDSSGDAEERRIVRTIYPSGLLASRVGKKPSPAAGEDPVARRYDYYYNSSGSLVETFDRLPAEAVEGRGIERERTTIIERDPAERQLRVNESWAGGRDTVFAYNADGTTASRRTDGKLKTSSGASCPAEATATCTYEGGKTTSFTYDALLQERTMSVTGNGPTRQSTTSYYPSGEPMTKERWTASQPHISESYFWRADGEIGQMKIDRPGTSVEGTAADKNELYAYDANGNRTADERGTHAFNARDQLVLWKRGAEQKVTPGSYVAYELNGSGAIKAQYDTGADQPDATIYDYFGDSSRIETVTSDDPATDDSRSSYRYDDFGNVTAIQTKIRTGTGSFPAPDEPSSDPCAGWSKTDTVYYCYDQFERLVATKSAVPEGSTKSPERNDYVYDGLDRRDLSISDGAGTSGRKVREHFYVGMSELLSREETRGGGRDSYDYDSLGSRQGQATTSASGATTYHGYGKDANGSVETIEDENGAVDSNDRYVYDPYGQLEDPNTNDANAPEDSLSQEAQDNPFRFEGFYYDSGVESYDMQAREYRPEVGRFLSQDRFAAASGDMQLQADPLTQDRYAFAGGNPVSNLEWDGHMPRRESTSYMTPRQRRRYTRSSRRQEARAYARRRRFLSRKVVEHPGMAYVEEPAPITTSLVTGDPQDLKGALAILDWAYADREPAGAAGFANGVYKTNSALYESVKNDPLGTAAAAVKGIPETIKDPGSLFECPQSTNGDQCAGERFGNLFGLRGGGSILGRGARRSGIGSPNRDLPPTSLFAVPTGAIRYTEDGALTNGRYRTRPSYNAKHTTGKTDTDASQFLYHVDAERAVIEAAAYADEAGLWKGYKAKVFVENGPIGVLGRSGELTSYLNVYRGKGGRVHGAPGAPP